MTRKCYDSTTASDTPKGAPFYLAYADGSYTNVNAIHERHRGARVLTITVTGRLLDADICDTEPGNVGIPGAVEWAVQKKARGEIGILYFPASLRRAVAAECRRRGLKPGKDVLFLPAQYDGVAKIPRWAIGKQYLHGDKNHPGAYSGGHFDVSVLRDYIPGIDPKPPTPRRPLSVISAALAKRLTKRLSKRTHPLDGNGRSLLAGLAEQINRVTNLKG